MWLVHLFKRNNHITCLPYKYVYSSFIEHIVNLEICVISFTTMYLKMMSILECLFSCWVIESFDL